MRGQHAVPLPRGQALERDGVGAHRVRGPGGQPAGSRLAHAGHPRLRADVDLTVGVGEVASPSAADQDDVSGCGFDALAAYGLVEIGRGDLVSRRAGLQPERGRHVQQHAAADDRRDRVHAVLGVAAPDARFRRVGPAVQPAVLGHVRQRVDVGADVSAHEDQVVGGRPPVGTHLVAVPARERVGVGGVVGRLGHAGEERPAQVVDPHTAAHRVEQGVGVRGRAHVLRLFSPTSLLTDVSLTGRLPWRNPQDRRLAHRRPVV